MRSALAGALLLTLAVSPGLMSADTIPTFVPIGAGYEADTLQQFAAEAANVDTSGEVSILVLPIAYGVDPLSMSNGLRNQNLTLADNRRGQIEAACLAVIPSGETLSCRPRAGPRPRGRLPRGEPRPRDRWPRRHLRPRRRPGRGHGGRQQHPVRGSPRPRPARWCGDEREQCWRGRRIGRHVAGFTGNNGPEQGLEQGSVDVWSYSGPTDTERGLVFGLQDVLLDQHVFQRGRIARLINASFCEHELGIGVDANTAATIKDGTNLTEIGGDTGAFVADSLTYPAPPTSMRPGRCRSTTSRPRSCRLAMATTWLHASRSSVVPPCPAPDITGRAFPTLATPAGSGPLLLAGGSPSAAVLDRLVTNSGGTGSKIVVIAAGYAKSELATKDAKAFAASLAAGGATATWFVLDSKTKTADVTAALCGGPGRPPHRARPGDRPLQPDRGARGDRRDPGRVARGAALLANDAAASAISARFTADARPGDSTAEIEAAASR